MANKDKKPKGGRGKSSKKREKKKAKVDLFHTAVMPNAYYISHNAAAFLEFRGYPCPVSLKKKGKKGKPKPPVKPLL